MTTRPLNEVCARITGLTLDCTEKSPDNYRWSLKRDGLEIGAATITRFYTPRRRWVRIAINTLDVLAAYQGQGLGSAIMTELCRTYGNEEMQLVAVAGRERFPRLRRFYERFGFEPYRAGRSYAYMRRKATGEKNK